MSLQPIFGEHTIDQLTLMFKNRQINLDPGFQRNSVWTYNDQMKGTELFSELLMSIHNGGILNKKTALDRAIGNDSVNGNTLARVSREFVRTMRLVRRMFPDLRQTRFQNSVEFYTLFLLVWEMNNDDFILTDRKRNRTAFALLRKLSTGVDELREKLRKVASLKNPNPVYQKYLLTVQGDTDSGAN